MVLYNPLRTTLCHKCEENFIQSPYCTCTHPCDAGGGYWDRGVSNSSPRPRHCIYLSICLHVYIWLPYQVVLQCTCHCRLCNTVQGKRIKLHKIISSTFILMHFTEMSLEMCKLVMTMNTIECLSVQRLSLKAVYVCLSR